MQLHYHSLPGTVGQRLHNPVDHPYSPSPFKALDMPRGSEVRESSDGQGDPAPGGKRAPRPASETEGGPPVGASPWQDGRNELSHPTPILGQPSNPTFLVKKTARRLERYDHPVTIQGDPRCLEHEALTWEEEAALPSYALPPQRPPVRGGAARKAAKSGA